MSADLSAFRKPYCGKTEILSEKDVQEDPFAMFHQWFEKAKLNVTPHTEINAVCLATATSDGKPSSRMVLLKSYDPENGFTVFTNYHSRKGREIEQNPNVALLFYWDFLNRQIRIEGRASKVPPSVSDEYFNKRPVMSRISARISDQSRPVDSRETMVRRQADESERFANSTNVPRPEHWGGFHIVPERFEFWQGQSDRLHDRFVFTRPRDGSEKWSYQRIQP